MTRTVLVACHHMTDPVWLCGSAPHYRPFAVGYDRETCLRMGAAAIFQMTEADALAAYRAGRVEMNAALAA